MSKYKSRKTVVDGIAFDSAKEARRWKELQILERAGQIQDLERQVKFILIPAQYETVKRYNKDGKRLKDWRRIAERECAYIADFMYRENGVRVVEDTKGFKTPDYIIKRKLMLFIHGIRVREV